MITRNQHINIMLDRSCKENNIDNHLYKAGFLEGARLADESLLDTFKLWLNHSLKYGKFLLDERGYQDEEEILKSFKRYLGL